MTAANTPDATQADDGRAESIATCGWCGKNPATGFATICDVRLCHGDDDDDPTCYQLQQWEISATGSFMLQLHPRIEDFKP